MQNTPEIFSPESCRFHLQVNTNLSPFSSGPASELPWMLYICEHTVAKTEFLMLQQDRA